MSSLSTLIFLTIAVIFVSSAVAGKKKECQYCEYDEDCSTHFCFKNKCLYRNRKSLTKCFVDLCGYCKYDYECISERCYQYKCVPKLNPHFKKCFPHKPTPSSTPSATPTPSSSTTPSATPTPSPSPKKADCEPCKYAYECWSGYCTDYYCGTPYTVNKYCKKDECDACDYDYECKSDKCKHGICIKNRHSVYKCIHH